MQRSVVSADSFLETVVPGIVDHLQTMTTILNANNNNTQALSQSLYETRQELRSTNERIIRDISAFSHGLRNTFSIAAAAVPVINVQTAESINSTIENPNPLMASSHTRSTIQTQPSITSIQCEPYLKAQLDSLMDAYNHFTLNILPFEQNNPVQFKAWKKNQKRYSRLKAVPDAVQAICSTTPSKTITMALDDLENWRLTKRYSVSRAIEMVRKEFLPTLATS